MTTKKIYTLLIILLSGVLLNAQTEPYEDLLEHRSGFGQNVTGGAGGELVILNTLDFNTFKDAVTSEGAKWIRFAPGLTGEIEIDGNLKISSNKTIDGRGADITLTSPGDCDEINFWGSDHTNLIVHNIKIIEEGAGDNCGQALGIAFGASKVWIDHVTFMKNGDESVSTGQGATSVTVSWCKFDDTPKGALLSWGPNYPSDSATHVTIHHCAFINGVSRCPKIRRGKVHFYNNVVEDWGWSASEVNTFGQFLSEYNIYDNHNSGNSIAIRNLSDAWDPQIGYVCARENSLRGDAHYEGDNFDCSLVFEASDYYDYQPDSISQIMRQVIIDYSGWSENPEWPVCDTMVSARFRLTVDIAGAGTVIYDDKEYAYGDVATLTASPDSGWVFKEWSGDASGTGTSLQVIMNADKHIVANFSDDVFRLVTTTEGNGNVSWSSNGIYLNGSVVNVLAFPMWGFKFLYWRGPVADSLSAMTTVTMDSDKHLTAVFSTSTGINENGNGLSAEYNLHNFPNPFSSVTTISYELKNATHVELVVYNMLGEKITDLVNRNQQPGKHQVDFDGSGLPQGVYYYLFRTGNYEITKKMLIF